MAALSFFNWNHSSMDDMNANVIELLLSYCRIELDWKMRLILICVFVVVVFVVGLDNYHCCR